MKPVKVITYGRSSQNEKSFPTDPKMSRVHCQIIRYDNGMYQIIDFGSANGTWVNGRCIPKSIPQPLQTTDVVRIGETTLRWMDDFYAAGSGSGSGSGNGHGNGSGSGHGNGYGNGSGNDDGYVPDPEPTHGIDASSILTLVAGIVSLGLIAYLIIGYFTSATYQLASMGGEVFDGFVIYLHGWFGIGGQWFAIVAAIVVGGLADLFNSLSDSDDNGAKTAGLWMGNIGVTIGVIFLILAIFAEQIVK